MDFLEQAEVVDQLFTLGPEIWGSAGIAEEPVSLGSHLEEHGENWEAQRGRENEICLAYDSGSCWGLGKCLSAPQFSYV